MGDSCDSASGGPDTGVLLCVCDQEMLQEEEEEGRQEGAQGRGRPQECTAARQHHEGKGETLSD